MRRTGVSPVQYACICRGETPLRRMGKMPMPRHVPFFNGLVGGYPVGLMPHFRATEGRKVFSSSPIKAILARIMSAP